MKDEGGLVEMFMEMCTVDQHFKIRREFKTAVMNKLSEMLRKKTQKGSSMRSGIKLMKKKGVLYQRD